MDVGRQNWRKIAILLGPSQPFRTKWTLDVKNWGKIAILKYPSQPFRTKWTLDVKNSGIKLRFWGVNRNPYARNGRWTSKTAVKLRFWGVNRNPYARNEVRSPKTKVKLRCHGSGLCVWKRLCVKESVYCVWKSLCVCVKASVCKSLRV